MTELLPCPFCGTAAEINGYGYYHLGTEFRTVGCPNLRCRAKPMLVRQQSEEREFDLVEQWNTRTPSHPDSDVVEALTDARGEIEWWVAEHQCCAGRETGALATIDATLSRLKEKDGAKVGNEQTAGDER